MNYFAKLMRDAWVLRHSCSAFTHLLDRLGMTGHHNFENVRCSSYYSADMLVKGIRDGVPTKTKLWTILLSPVSPHLTLHLWTLDNKP